MARELGPQNIHVAHLIIDAGVDTAFVRERIKARGGDAAVAGLKPDQLMNPQSIASSSAHSFTTSCLNDVTISRLVC